MIWPLGAGAANPPIKRIAAIAALCGAALGSASLLDRRGKAGHPLEVPLSHRAEKEPDGKPLRALSSLVRRPLGPARTLEQASKASPVSLSPVPALDPAPTPSKGRIAGWIIDLLDDDIRGNARDACFHLIQCGAAAKTALFDALDSSDLQQRQYAAYILGEIGAEPTDRWIQVVFEGLANDRWPRQRATSLALSGSRATYNPELANATCGYRRLRSLGARVWPHIRPGLHSGDIQQRFITALILAHTKDVQSAARVTTILAGHLSSNEQAQDALLSCAALFAFREHTAGYLERIGCHGDQQCELLVAYLLERMASPEMGDVQLLQLADQYEIRDRFQNDDDPTRFDGSPNFLGPLFLQSLDDEGGLPR